MSKLEELIAKLSELFELDKADLDFGIHRIIKSKHKQIREYLETRLPARVQEELGKLAVEEAAQQLESLRDKVKDQYGKAAFTEAGEIREEYTDKPECKDYLLAKDEAESYGVSSKTENEVYSHLLEFFSRYYEDADFMSLRRRTAGRESYAIPYNGEEVVLHWANKDQYYIKSSEDLKDYTFLVDNPDAPAESDESAADSSDAGGEAQSAGSSSSTDDSDSDQPPQHLRVQFKLMKMDAVANNNKASRIFQLYKSKDEETGESSVEIIDSEAGLVIPFHFAEGKKRKKSDNEAWEQSIFEQLPEKWQGLLGADDASYTGDGSRTILQKHLRNYTKKNTSDYFIHKDLGGFLRRELDFYVKNEVMYLDDIENRPVSYVESELRKIKAIRAVAHNLIDFLAQFENFQKKLWLKKKFVVETNWLVSLGRIPEALYGDIAENTRQHGQWTKDYSANEIQGFDELGEASEAAIEFLRLNPHLIVDTQFFEREFVWAILGELEDIDSQQLGLLVESENYQAISQLKTRYSNAASAIYIDPPYNTDAGPINYKNGYRSSSWISFIQNRVENAKSILANTGILCVTIDDYQVHELAHLLESEFSPELLLGTVAIRNNPSGRSTVAGFSICHEYAFFCAATEDGVIRRLPRSEAQLSRFTIEDGEYVDWRNFRKDGGAVTHRSERPKQFYPLYVDSDFKIRIPKLDWDSGKRTWNVLDDPLENEQVIYPIDENERDRVWSLNHVSAAENMDSLEAREDRGGKLQVYRRHIPADGVLPRTWWDKNTYAAREHGSATLRDLFGNNNTFSFAKSPHAVSDCVWISGLDARDAMVMDFFAGSGTTGHAAIQLNREDEGRRKFILVEVEEYFHSVLLPRIRKVAYAEEWEGGRPVLTESRSDAASVFYKYIRLESYEDALNNLVLMDQEADLLGQPDVVRDEYLIRYFLKSEATQRLMHCEHFTDPFGHLLKIYDRDTMQSTASLVDLPETFNYLLGLRVRTMQMKEGTLVIEGENPSGETVLVIWRNVDEMDNKKLKEFVEKKLRINTADTEYAAIYINGDTTLNDPHKKILLTEQVFHDLMFDVEDV